jgi:S1-C subfamily serine protease
MRKSLLIPLLTLFCAASGHAQTASVRLKLRVVLVDKDLNQKPVPFFTVALRSAAEKNALTELKTGLDGMAEGQLSAGAYSLTTPKPVEFGGKRYNWNMSIELKGTAQEIDLTNDNAKAEEIAAATPHPSESSSSAPSGQGDLTALFDKLKNSVVTVRAERGTGSGFLVDPSGLIVTNNHVAESSSYLAVQFDEKRKVPSKLVAANADKDIAVLWVNLAAFPEAVVAPLQSAAGTRIAVGERVFTIGNPLGHEKVLTTGVISKVEKDAITSDININPGNSGGPLFTLSGQVAGITTSTQRRLASIVPLENVRPLVEQAKKTIAGGTPPPIDLLPVEPVDFFPADALRPLLQHTSMDTKPYFFDAGEFQVALYTPPLSYFLRHENEMAAARKAVKRTGGFPAEAKPPAGVLEDAQDYRPVLIVRVRPKYSAFWKVRFKNGFQRMRLLCGGKELAPINPGRSEYELVDPRGRTVDTTFQGIYVYGPDTMSPSCGPVTLEIFSEKDANTPFTRPIDTITVERVWADLEPYRKAHIASSGAAASSSATSPKP